jgi:epsilon-lactone hydrolase
MVSPEMAEVIKMIRENKPEKAPTIEEMRTNAEAMVLLLPLAEDIQCEPVDAEGVSAEWVFAPGAADDRLILYLHGGGYVMGSINTHREMVSHISRAAQARVLIINYRLAPEHPFPAAVEDAKAAFRWLLNQGFDPARVVIAGDSAGGGLTVATLVALKDDKIPMPAAAVCMSPWVDLEACGESMNTKAEADPMVDRQEIIRIAKAYLAETNARTPLASPLYTDLHGLPPLFIQVGTSEVLLDDALRLAEKAKDAGVNVTLEPWEEMTHGWQLYASRVPEAKEAVKRIGIFILEHTS